MISTEILRRFPFFHNLDEAQLRALAMIADENLTEGNHSIFEEGTAANKFYLLISGNIDLFVKSEEENDPKSRRDFAVGEVNPGEVFGISALLEPLIYRVSARTANECRWIEFDAVSLRAITQSDPGLAYQLIVQVAKALMDRLQSTRVQLAAAW